MTRFIVLFSLLAAASAFTVQQTAVRPTTKLSESFGFDFAEDSYENTPDIILGEANYKQWVDRVEPNSFLNRQYNVLRRVRELDLLKSTVDNGILSKLEKNGLDLVTIEKLLPVIEELGLLGVAANNQQLLINALGFLVIEGSPFILPVIAGALEVGPSAFYLASAGAFGLDALLLANNVEVPFLGLSAGVVLGLLLVPVGVATGGVGYALSNLNKK